MFFVFGVLGQCRIHLLSEFQQVVTSRKVAICPVHFLTLLGRAWMYGPDLHVCFLLDKASTFQHVRA